MDEPSVDTELLRLAIAVAEAAIENATACMQIHDSTLGRTTRKNKHIGDLLDGDIELAQRLMRELKCHVGATRENS